MVFSVSGWIAAGEPEQAERVLHEAEQIQKRFAERYPQADRTREARVALVLMRAYLENDQGHREQEAILVNDAWLESRPTDYLACSAVRALIRGEAALGLLAETNPKEWFTQELSHPYFVVDNALLSRHDGELTRVHWRFLQALSNRDALQVHGRHSFSTLILNLAPAAGGIPLDPNCYQDLLLLLGEAEKYFHTEDPSNANERRAIELRVVLDNTSADAEQHLAELAAEERQLQERAARLHDVMQQSDWLASFLALNTRKKSAPKGGSVASAYMEVTTLAAMFSDGSRETILKALAPRVATIRRESPQPIDLVCFRLYLLAVKPEDRERLQREFDQLIGTFIANHVVAGHESPAAALRDRLTEWADGLVSSSARHGAARES